MTDVADHAKSLTMESSWDGDKVRETRGLQQVTLPGTQHISKLIWSNGSTSEDG